MTNEAYTEGNQDVAIVESVLGMPLFPEGFDVGRALSEQPEGRRDVRISAAELTLSALAHMLGRHPTDQAPLSQQEQSLLRDHQDIRFLQNLVAIANNVYAAEAQNSAISAGIEGADNPSTPRAQVQLKLTQGMFSHAQTVPDGLQFLPDKPLHEQFDDTYVVIAPTAVGKTVLEATILREAGIGKKASASADKAMKGMVVTSSLKLVYQFAGSRGDNTFRRFLGDGKVTRFDGRKKDEEGPVVVTTDRSMLKLDSRDYAMSVIDEAHLALSRQALEYIHRIGNRCFMFTATPAYSNRADLRRLFKYVEEGTLRGFVEQGVLNPTRLLTFYYDQQPELMAAVLADQYLKAGRKVVIYCQNGTKDNPGGPSRQVVELVNELQGRQIGQAVGHHNKHSDRDVARFDKGELKLLATSRMLREGWNADVDVAICIGPHFSMLDLQQKIGRPLRPGRFISELIELVPRNRTGNRPMVSLWQLFGLEEVISGSIIGPVDEGGGCLIPPDDSWMFNSEGSASPSREASAARSRPDAIDLSALPADILEQMVADKPVRDIVMGANFLPTDGFMPSSAFAARFEVPVRFVHLKLDQQGFRYEGRWLPDEDGELRYERWYEPAANDFLEANPIPKGAEEIELIAEEAAALCSVSKQFFIKMAQSLNIKPHNRLNKKRDRTKRYDLNQLATILAAIEAIPLAAEDDVPLASLQDELSNTFAPNSKGIYKRRHPAHGIIGWCQHVSFAEAEEMRAAYYAIPVADERFMSMTGAARAADVTLTTLRDNLTETEKNAIIQMRKQPRSQPLDHLPRSVADPLIERIKSDALEAHLVPFSIIKQRVNRSDPVLREWLKASVYKPLSRRITKRPSFCFPWKALQDLEQEFGRKPGVSVIDFNNLVHNPLDFNEERWEYTQAVQKRHLNQVAIKRLQRLEDARRKVQSEVTTAITEPVQPAIANIPVKPHIERPTPIEKPKPRPLPAPEIPADYVDLEWYLEERNLACEPSIARLLARSNSVPPPITANDERQWASEETAVTLEEAISEYEVAQPGVLSPFQIAALFPGTGLTGKHVTHLARKFGIEMQGRTQICRELLADGQPGALRLHYDLTLTSEIRELLSGVVRNKIHLQALLNFSDRI